MVLDIDRFRPEKGGNPQEVKENQRKRYSDESIVDKIVAADENWRKARFDADNWNKLKNLASKVIGEKMKRKEAQGDDDTLSNEITENLAPLTVFQIKKVRSLIDQAIADNQKDLLKHEKERDDLLRETGNWLHASVPISNDEDKDNRTERTYGDIKQRKKY